MFDSFGNAFNRKPSHKGGPIFPEPSVKSPLEQNTSERKAVYTKIFRWCPPDGQTQTPGTVEVAGTFTHWQKVPLIHDSAVGSWHVTLHHIPGTRRIIICCWLTESPHTTKPAMASLFRRDPWKKALRLRRIEVCACSCCLPRPNKASTNQRGWDRG